MTGHEADLKAYIDASAAALGLHIEPEWHSAVRSNLEGIFAMASNLDTFDLPSGGAKAEALAKRVGLPQTLLDRFPHQLSGGQKARVGIARAIALSPALLLLDEPTAALDVSAQAVVLNLLADLKQELGMSYLFVSHDLPVVRLLCDRVLVMKSGEIVEQGETAAVLSAPRHTYTAELLAAAPKPPL